MERGKFQFIDRARQLISFEGLRIGKITPTDIDGAIEYRDKAYIFIEVKHRNKEIPLGQRIALERLVKDTGEGKKSLAIVCEHCTDDTSQHIDMANCMVRDLFLSIERRWRPPNKKVTVKQIVDLFVDVVVEGVDK